MVDKQKIFLQLLVEEMIPELGTRFFKEEDDTKITINDEVAEEIVAKEEWRERLYEKIEDELSLIIDEYVGKNITEGND